MQEHNDLDFYVPPTGLARLHKFILSHGYDLTVPALGEGEYPPFIDREPGEGKYPLCAKARTPCIGFPGRHCCTGQGCGLGGDRVPQHRSVVDL